MTGSASQKDIPDATSCHATYVEIMASSPCAKFTIPVNRWISTRASARLA